MKLEHSCIYDGFILEAASFTLLNNNLKFVIYMFLQLVGTRMGSKFAPPYACFSVGCSEETILFPQLLLLHLTLPEYKLIEKIFKRFIEDVFRDLLNELHHSLKFTIKKRKNSCE